MSGPSREELIERADWVMRRTEALLRENGGINAEWYFGRGHGSLLYRLRLNDEMASWMNRGTLKAVLFSVIRHAAERAKYDCAVFASDTWLFESNEEYSKLTTEQQRAVQDRGFKKAVALGYGKVHEAICVTGQTPEWSVVLTKHYQRDPLNPDKVRKVDDYKFPPECETRLSGGRSVMFGEWNEPGMEQAYRKVREFPEYRELMATRESLTTLVNIRTEDS